MRVAPTPWAVAGPYSDWMNVSAPTAVDTSVLGLCEGNADWRPLPPWMRFHLEAGLSVARAEANRTRCVLAISAPSRGYAAALCAAGAVLAAYEIESAGNALGWFRELSALPRGTPLTVREGQRIKRGLSVGVRERNGVTALGIQLERGRHGARSGGLTLWLPAGQCLRVGIADRETAGLPARQRGKLLQSVNRFAAAVLSPLDARRFTEPGTLACLIFGSRRAVEADALYPGFAVRTADARITDGVLNDLMRLRKTAGTGAAWRSSMLPPHASRIPAVAPRVVIFDGAGGYLNGRRRFPASHAIAVLDRTDPRYADAVAQLQGDYARRAGGGMPRAMPSPPPGVETLHFRQAAA